MRGLPLFILLILACRRMDAIAYSITFPLLSIATSYFIFELKRQEQIEGRGASRCTSPNHSRVHGWASLALDSHLSHPL